MRLLLALLLLILLPGSRAADAQDFKALVFSKTAGFRHASIPDGLAALRALGDTHGFTVDATEDAAVFTDAGLAPYQVVVFLSTTGDVLDAAQQAAFERYIRAGGGFVGIHAAADTEYAWSFYGALVGAYFRSHPAIQQATVKVADGVHPSTAHLPKRWARTDEWYDYRANPRGTVHVLATLDEATYSGGTMGHDHPIAWCQVYEGGRSWYTAGGHTSESFQEPLFRTHLLGGLRYAAGVVPGDCGATVGDHFEKVILEDDVDNPVDLAVTPDGRVLFIELGGAVRIHDPVTSITHTAARLDVWEGNENGLIGLALDPAFAENAWVYLFYTPDGPEQRQRLARFTLDGTTLDLASEKVLLEVPITRDQCCHAGGSMAFDGDGHLFVALGDDTNPFASDGYAPLDERPGRAAWDAQRSSANTDDLRGKILRITPQPDGSYTIPEGNLFPHGDGGRPEIYAMGLRNPYRIAVDTETGWLYWGDVGPDARSAQGSRGPAGLDEWNQARGPGNFGWPYCIGPNRAYRAYDYDTGASGPAYDCAAPVNDSPNNTGSSTLPPARPAWIWYPYGTSPEFPQIPAGGGRTAMAGPIYHYDPALDSPTKLPAYYDDTVFLYEWSRNWIQEVKLDDEGEILEINPFLPGLELIRPITMRFGPEGALYLLEWGSGFDGDNRDARLARVDYASGPGAPVAVVTAAPTDGPVPLTVHFSAAGSYHPDPAGTLAYQWDFDADDVADAEGPEATHTYTEPGAYTARLTVTDADGRRDITGVTIIAGNTAPEVTMAAPAAGGFFAWGDRIPFRLAVTDAEDGSTTAGTIDCAALTFQVQIGHDDHGHPTSPLHACEGVVQTPYGHGSPAADIFLVAEALYTDVGFASLGAITERVQHVLYPRHVEAEHYDTHAGTELEDSEDPAGGVRHVAWIDDGDYIAFSGMNLHRIGFVTYRVASAGPGGRIELRADAPDGPLLGTAHVAPTGGWHAFEEVTAPVTDPGGPRDLYFVFRREPGDAGLFNLNWIDFHGPGVADRSARGPEGLTATYYPDPAFFGADAVRLDPQINFNWRTDPPVDALGPGSFSVRWRGQVEAERTGAYTFTTRSSGTARLYLDGELLIDHTAAAGVAEAHSRAVSLAGGTRYGLVAEYVHTAGEAQMHLLWSRDGAAPAVVPARQLYPDAPSGIPAETPPPLPDRLALEPAYPNPFTHHTTLTFTLPEAGPVQLELFDVTGRRVAVLADGFHPAGRHRLDLPAGTLPGGLYLCRLTTPGGSRVRQVALIR